MELTIFERLLLLRALPAEGNLITLRIVRDLRTNLSMTEEEIKVQEVHQDETTQLIRWKDPAYVRMIEIGEVSKDVIVKTLSGLNWKDVSNLTYIPLCVRFEVNPDEDEILGMFNELNEKDKIPMQYLDLYEKLITKKGEKQNASEA